MRDLKFFAAAVLGAGLLAASAGVAQAESPPPFGFWTTPDGGEQLLVTQGGQCSLADGYGQITTSGSCSWNATSGGGILTIMSDQQFQRAPVYFNVIWVNNTAITVNGDPFYLREQ
jgi:hypothetical protein